MKPGQTIEQVRCRDSDDTMIPRLRGRYFRVYPPRPRSALCPLAAYAINHLVGNGRDHSLPAVETCAHCFNPMLQIRHLAYAGQVRPGRLSIVFALAR